MTGTIYDAPAIVISFISRKAEMSHREEEQHIPEMLIHLISSVQCYGSARQYLTDIR